MTWHVIDNDLIGGWCVADRDKPLSEWANEVDGKVIAECCIEEDAALIARLLNREKA